MSGGVDSSTVAALLVRQGHNDRRHDDAAVEPAPAAGARPGDGRTGRCCSLDDVYDARRVAEQVGIPYYVVNFEQQFEEQVVKPFVDEYLAGRTPIPCTLCNNYIKFDRFLEMADAVGAHQIATGHYARVRFDEPTGRYQLLRAARRIQGPDVLPFRPHAAAACAHAVSAGRMDKPEVRELAREHGSRGGLQGR